MSATWMLVATTAAVDSFADEDERPTWAPSAVSFAFRNDNYTANREAGEAGRYFGPDDFLTMSWLMRAHWGEWRVAFNHDTVTSRRFGLRYDLVSGLAERSFSYDPFVLRHGLGVLFKGDFGAQSVRNLWHRSRNLAEIVLPYRDAGFAVVTTLAGDWVVEDLLLPLDRLSASVDLRVYSSHVPSRSSPHLKYQLRWHRVELEAIGGWRLYLNEAPDYSEMVRHGPVGAMSLRVGLVANLFVEAGLGFIPVQNVDPDPGCLPRDYRWLPQICMGVSWNSAGESATWMFDP